MLKIAQDRQPLRASVPRFFFGVLRSPLSAPSPQTIVQVTPSDPKSRGSYVCLCMYFMYVYDAGDGNRAYVHQLVYSWLAN